MKHPRKIIVHIATSADGFIARPDGNVAWLDRPRPKGHYGVLDGLFDSPVSSEDVIRRIKEKFGKRWKTSYVQTYMRKFMEAGVIHAVKPVGHKGNYWILASMKREQALKVTGKKRKVLEVEEELFSEKLTKRLKKTFGRELEELHDNFGKNGNCTTFLLRKSWGSSSSSRLAKMKKTNCSRTRPNPVVGLALRR